MDSSSSLDQSRDKLPAKAAPHGDISLWSVLKQAIGKELSKITMPIQFNEPLSFLQRLAEYMEYSSLLDAAAECTDAVQRMQYVSAFAVSGLASNWLRLGKPFNPLLCETYQQERMGYRIICEQVSHHPPISAFHAEASGWRFHGSIHPKIKFWGKSVEVQPKGTLTIELPKWNETYTWNNVNCCIHNIIVGKLWIENYGTMEIINHASGHRCELVFKPAGWFARDLHCIEGFITDSSKAKKVFLYGKWTEYMKCADMSSYEEYLNSNPARILTKDSSKETTTVTAHTPRKMLAKFSSLTIGSFKQSTDESNGSDDVPIPPEPEIDEDIPKSSFSLTIPNSVVLWTATTRPENSSDYYHFTSFAMALNELPSATSVVKLQNTDSRFRPDIRLMEMGNIDKASQEKTRLEEKQRQTRKQKKSSKEREQLKARWFIQSVHPFTKQEDWFFNGSTSALWQATEHNSLNIF